MYAWDMTQRVYLKTFLFVQVYIGKGEIYVSTNIRNYKIVACKYKVKPPFMHILHTWKCFQVRRGTSFCSCISTWQRYTRMKISASFQCQCAVCLVLLLMIFKTLQWMIHSLEVDVQIVILLLTAQHDLMHTYYHTPTILRLLLFKLWFIQVWLTIFNRITLGIRYFVPTWLYICCFLYIKHLSHAFYSLRNFILAIYFVILLSVITPC